MDLFLNYHPLKTAKDQMNLPVLYHSQYFSSRMGADEIIIRQFDNTNSSLGYLSWNSHKQDTLEGTYMLGVYGHRNSTYSLFIT